MRCGGGEGGKAGASGEYARSGGFAPPQNWGEGKGGAPELDDADLLASVPSRRYLPPAGDLRIKNKKKGKGKAEILMDIFRTQKGATAIASPTPTRWRPAKKKK